MNVGIISTSLDADDVDLLILPAVDPIITIGCVWAFAGYNGVNQAFESFIYGHGDALGNRVDPVTQELFAKASHFVSLLQ
jgi:hypothetical protein